MTDVMNPPAPDDSPQPPADGSRRNLWIALGVVAALIVAFGIWKVSNTVAVPSVVGMSQTDATAQLTEASLKVGRVSEEATIAFAPGTVFSQSPAPTANVAKNSAVDLTVAAVPVVAVPDVVGVTESDADAALASAGLRMGNVTGVFSDAEKAGIVLSQTPAASTEVTIASLVDLEISLGAKQGTVPDVVGLTSADAKDLLKTAGFASSEAKSTSADVEAGLVISQAPGAGTVAAAESTVKITVSTGAPAAPEAPAETPSTPATEPAAPTPAPEPKPEPPAPKPETATVPNIVGSRVLEALRSLREAKLGFKIAWGPTTEGYLTVISQDPKAGASVDPGTVVTMTIGLPEFLFSGVEVQPLPAPAPSTPSTPSSTPGSEASTLTTP